MLTRGAAAIVLQLDAAVRFAADHLTAAIKRNGTATQDRLLQLRTAALDAGLQAHNSLLSYIFFYSVRRRRPKKDARNSAKLQLS